MIISERIFEYLREKGITQKEFSEKTGISQSTISDWKTKRTNPAADKIVLICDALGISPNELLSGSESKYEKNMDYMLISKASDEYRLLETYRGMSSKNKEHIMHYIEKMNHK